MKYLIELVLVAVFCFGAHGLPTNEKDKAEKSGKLELKTVFWKCSTLQ